MGRVKRARLAETGAGGVNQPFIANVQQRDMRRLTAITLLITGALAPLHLRAQTHRVQDPGAVTRAISVFEWTGDEINKPTAARMVPVSLFIHGHFEDAGVYMAQPIPLALEPDTRYFLQKSGVNTGVVDLSFARNLKAPGSAVVSNYDDGWFGYGKWRPMPKPKYETASIAKIRDEDDSKPAAKPCTPATPSRRPNIGIGGPGTGGGRQTGPQTNDPICDASGRSRNSKDDSAKRDGSTDSDNTKAEAADPERPTFKKEEIETGDPRKDRRKQDKKNDVSGVEAVPGGPGSEASAGGAAPADDSDRPVFRKRTASEAPSSDTVGVTEKRTELLGDPTRPTLHRGRPAGSVAGEDLGALKGLSENMHQSVAVSDAKDRPDHDFTHKFADDPERDKVKAQLEALARAVIATPILAKDTANANANPDLGGVIVPLKPVAGTIPPQSTKARSNSKQLRGARSAKAKAVPVPALSLEDEKFAAFDLAYNSVPTYVLTARTGGAAGTQEPAKYVTVVASPDTFGVMQPIMRSITDAAHLNLVPRLRLVDVVDPDASNRASLLFELRRQNSRFFALYRIYGAKAQQIYMSGVTQ